MNELNKLDSLVQSPDTENIALALQLWKSLHQPRWEWHEQMTACMQWYKAQLEKNFETIQEFIEEIQQNGLNLAFQSARLLPNYIQVLRFYTNDISLMHSSLNHVPDFVKAFTNLTNLDLSGNRIDRLPSWLWTLSQLKQLDLQDTYLRTLNEDIGKLQQLEHLKLGGLVPIPIPKSLKNISTLRILYYGINAYPDDVLNRVYTLIFDIPSLYSLTIASLKQFKIPIEFSNLNSLILLAFFDIDMVQFKSKLAQLPVLEHLILTGVSNIDMIWQDITQCKTLDVLEINSCFFESIPEQLQQLTQLRSLRFIRAVIKTNTMEYWQNILPQWLPNTTINWT